jgi:hypothetical protein
MSAPRPTISGGAFNCALQTLFHRIELAGLQTGVPRPAEAVSYLFAASGPGSASAGPGQFALSFSLRLSSRPP